jgi:hypothetical protein
MRVCIGVDLLEELSGLFARRSFLWYLLVELLMLVVSVATLYVVYVAATIFLT